MVETPESWLGRFIQPAFNVRRGPLGNPGELSDYQFIASIPPTRFGLIFITGFLEPWLPLGLQAHLSLHYGVLVLISSILGTTYTKVPVRITTYPSHALWENPARRTRGLRTRLWRGSSGP